ncbi:MAG: hypothetical protein DRI34_10020 [Deltaproteobacteria bacterium]|nr:MAG: hypothetical protein DRI34_10020 [Deltaproteobacteria bacterium]
MEAGIPTLAEPSGSGRRLSAFWTRAACFGALWGVGEVTLGAFLHALRLPFAGVLMAALAVIMLVAQRQLYRRRGLSLATGLVAALVKTLSPGGVILGPMAAILVEATLVELCLPAWPGSVVAAMAAGSLCSLWSAFQQLFTQYLLYGRNIIELYLAMLRRASGWLNLPAGAGWWVLGGVIALLVVVGTTSGWLGVRLGVVSRQRLQTPGAGESW